MSRYIDAEWLIAELKTVADRPIQSQLYIVRQAPSIDIVRCADCKYYEAKEDWCYWRDEAITADDFCSYGERKESE